MIVAENHYIVEHMRGRFIVLEGPDGSGTTTHSEILAQKLTEKGENILLTQEPTNGPIGLFIRQQLSLGTMTAAPLQMLFSADRAWHLGTIIEPALNEGKTVISDRYTLSTLLYGQALGLDLQWLEDMNTKFIQPDLHIVALPSFEVCFNRVNGRDIKDMLETESIQRKVYDRYAAYVHAHQLTVLDTAGSLQEVSDQLMALVA
jgi:dTMP kinase